VDGSVSLQPFRDQPVTIDLARGNHTLETPNPSDADAGHATSDDPSCNRNDWRRDCGVHRCPDRRTPRLVLLDSGNCDPLLIAPHVARMAGRPGNDGDVSVELDSIGAIRLPARTTQMIYDGVLGAAFMQEWAFTLDLHSNRMRATPARALSRG
jgi:hypothetical protein